MSDLDVQYLLKCTKAQRAKWQERADASNMSLAAYIRRCLDEGPVFVTRVERRS